MEVLTKNQEGIRKAKGANLSELVQVGIQMRKYSQSASPVRSKGSSSGASLSLELEIREKLGWASADQSFSYSLATLIERIKAAGIDDPNSYLSVQEASDATGLTTQEIWKLIVRGKLIRCDDRNDPESALIYVPSLFRIVLERDRRESEGEGGGDLSMELGRLCAHIVAQQKSFIERTDELISEFQRQNHSFMALKEENSLTMRQFCRLSEEVLECAKASRKRSLMSLVFGTN